MGYFSYKRFIHHVLFIIKNVLRCFTEEPLIILGGGRVCQRFHVSFVPFGIVVFIIFFRNLGKFKAFSLEYSPRSSPGINNDQ